MQPDIDRDALAEDVDCWMKEMAHSVRSASATYTGLNPAMLTRARRGDVMSAASVLLLCAVMGKNPLNYLRLVERRKEKQAVTAIVPRETRRESRP